MKKVEKITSSCNVCIYAADTSNCNAEVAGSSDGAAVVVENPVAAPTPALLNGIIKKGSKTYYYKDGVMQKTAGAQIRNSTLAKTEWLMQRRRRAVIRKML